jgi:hypothetical protein
VQTSQGYDLTVDGVFDGETFSDLTLTGPVRKVFVGRVTWESLDAGVE